MEYHTFSVLRAESCLAVAGGKEEYIEIILDLNPKTKYQNGKDCFWS